MKAPQITLAAALAISLFAACTLAAERTRTAVPTGDQQELPEINDVALSGNDVFAVGKEGLFYHYRAGKLTRVHSTSIQALRHVWASSPREVYALGERGTVLHYDGTSLGRLGPRLPTIKRKDHPFLEPRPCEPDLQCIWASSPRDVWVTGSPMIVLHFDGENWSEVDVGAEQIVVPSSSRLTRAVATPRVGPVWGTGPGDVWLRKEVLDKDAAAETRLHSGAPRERPPPEHRLMHFDGKKWRETDKQLPPATIEYLGRGVTRPEVQVVSPRTIWARFDHTLHRWRDSDWRPVARLPAADGPWTWWSGSEAEGAVIYSWQNGMRVLSDGRWQTVQPRPGDLGGSLPRLTADGTIVVRGPFHKQLFLGR